MAAPEPPPPPLAVVQLSELYERPTASLDQATAREIVNRHRPLRRALEALEGIAFFREVIAEAASERADTELGFDVQGALQVHSPCPGWNDETTPNEAETGFIELEIGVDSSRMQRAFTGRTRKCQFVSEDDDEHAPKLAVSMALEMDLGRSLGFGEPVPALLIRATELSRELDLVLGGFQFDREVEVLSLRVDEHDRLETLLELEPLGIGLGGTVLLALQDHGRVAVRGSEGEWVCGRKRREPCVLAD